MLFLIVLFCASAQAQLHVFTTEGPVQGLKTEQDYIAFYGIPYAGSVNGSNRFKAAPPPELRSDVFLADQSDISCANPYGGIENCLTVNIFTSNLTTSSRPVLVYLDANEYENRFSIIIPTFNAFVEQGIVVVTLNFRLSIFGFLCLGVEQAPGNAGIKDIIQGLEWINKNIEGFGGDSENVLLMGHGSAAALVDIVTMVPRANNLVHKAVTISGSALAPWAVAYEPVEYAKALGQALGLSDMSPADLANQFASTHDYNFIRPLNSFTFFNNTPLFAPCIENESVSLNDSVLTDSPINILRSGNYNHIPYIAIYVTEEGVQRSSVASVWISEMNKKFTNFLPVDLDLSNDTANTVESRIKNQYFRSSITTLDFQSYQADILTVVSVIRAARERALTSKSDVRLMEFGHMVNVTTTPTSTFTLKRFISYGDIKRFLFRIGLKQEEEVVAESLISRLTSFANNGVPSAPSSNSTPWTSIAQYSFSYLTYGLYLYNGVPSSREELFYNPRQDTMNYWNPLYAIWYKSLSPVPVPAVPVPSSAGQLGSILFVVLFSFVISRIV